MSTQYYSISMYNGPSVFFSGYFFTQGKTITAMYETVGGITNFSNNLLVTPLTPYTNQGIDANTGNLSYDLFTYTINGAYVENDLIVDNVYGSANGTYPGFTLNGVALTSMTYFNLPGRPTVYNFGVSSLTPSTTYFVYDSYNQYYSGDFTAVITRISSYPSCFLEDTKILTNKGYIPIQTLRKGDLVQTLKHGYKQIDAIGKNVMHHKASDERIESQLYKYSPDKCPEVFEDLIITGCHSLLVDSFTCDQQILDVVKVWGTNVLFVTDDKYRLPAVVDENSTVYEISGIYTIYHLALENDIYGGNYGIFANGLLVESCSKQTLIEKSKMILIE